MRLSMVVKSVLVLVSTLIAVQAVARPYKIEYHPAICQKLNGATIAYHIDTITTSTGSSVVCPLEQVTMPEDSLAMNHITFKAWVASASSASSCELDTTGGSIFASISGFTSTLGVGFLTGAGPFAVSTAVDSDPSELYVLCDFKAAGTLGSIQVKMVP